MLIKGKSMLEVYIGLFFLGLAGIGCFTNATFTILYFIQGRKREMGRVVLECENQDHALLIANAIKKVVKDNSKTNKKKK